MSGEIEQLPTRTLTHVIGHDAQGLAGRAVNPGNATTATAGLMSAADKTKLDGVAAGATANASDAALRDRATHTGSQAISTVTGLQTALDGKAATTHAHTASQISDSTAPGRALLTAASDTAQRSALGLGGAAILNVGTAAGTVAAGNDARLSDARTPTAHVHVTGDITGFAAAAAAAAPVQSVAGRTGAVTLAKADVGLGNVDNTSDAAKPISTATATALAGKANTSHTHVDADIASLSASKLTGTIDPARLPVLPSSVQIVSSGAIADLTAPQQADIGDGSIVTTTDGRRWVYTGSGSKTLEASYIVLADVTPDWASIANRPGTVTGSADGLMSAADKTKLDTIASGATANATDAALRDRATHTGSQAISTVTGLQTALDGKSNTGHTHTASQVTDFAESVDDRVAALIVGGSNITAAYNDAAGTLTVSAAGANLTIANRTATALDVLSDTGTDVTLPAATGTLAGLLTGADKGKLDGIASGATANATDAQLRDRTTHTGTQAASTITDFAEAVDDRVAALIVPGTNITTAYNDAAGTLTITGADFTNWDGKREVGSTQRSPSHYDDQITIPGATNTPDTTKTFRWGGRVMGGPLAKMKGFWNSINYFLSADVPAHLALLRNWLIRDSTVFWSAENGGHAITGYADTGIGTTFPGMSLTPKVAPYAAGITGSVDNRMDGTTLQYAQAAGGYFEATRHKNGGFTVGVEAAVANLGGFEAGNLHPWNPKTTGAANSGVVFWSQAGCGLDAVLYGKNTTTGRWSNDPQYSPYGFLNSVQAHRVMVPVPSRAMSGDVIARNALVDRGSNQYWAYVVPNRHLWIWTRQDGSEFAGIWAVDSVQTDAAADWANGTVYAVGARALDPHELTTWECLVAHTAPLATLPAINVTFDEYRAANPTHWALRTNAGHSNTTSNSRITIRHDLQRIDCDSVQGINAAQYMIGGQRILRTNTSDNIALGINALAALTTGANNVAIGTSAGLALTTGINNTLLGRQAGEGLTTGGNNTLLGVLAGDALTTQSGCTAVGRDALLLATAGSNTALGHLALSSLTTAVNCTGLGANAQITGSNQIQIGDSATTTYVFGTVQNRSDARDKADIEPTKFGLDFLKTLRPVDYRWDMREDYQDPAPVAPIAPTALEKDSDEEAKAEYASAMVAYDEAMVEYRVQIAEWAERRSRFAVPRDGSKKRKRLHSGLIAQEVQDALRAAGVDHAVLQDHSVAGGGDVMTLGYDEFVPMLIAAVQELSARLEKLEASPRRRSSAKE